MHPLVRIILNAELVFKHPFKFQLKDEHFLHSKVTKFQSKRCQANHRCFISNTPAENPQNSSRGMQHLLFPSQGTKERWWEELPAALGLSAACSLSTFSAVSSLSTFPAVPWAHLTFHLIILFYPGTTSITEDRAQERRWTLASCIQVHRECWVQTQGTLQHEGGELRMVHWEAWRGREPEDGMETKRKNAFNILQLRQLPTVTVNHNYYLTLKNKATCIQTLQCVSQSEEFSLHINCCVTVQYRQTPSEQHLRVQIHCLQSREKSPNPPGCCWANSSQYRSIL